MARNRVKIPIFAGMEKIPVIKFFKHKYGDELLVDLNDIGYMRHGIEKQPVHRCGFYCLILVTDGCEEIGIDDRTATAERGVFLAGTPGDVWRWKHDTQLQGYVLVFEEEFLLSFFNDRLFLQKFSYLAHDRRTPFYRLDDELFGRLCSVMRQLQTEIHGDQTDLRTTSLPRIDHHILRALLYEALVLLNRAGSLADFPEKESAANRFVEPFMAMVEQQCIAQRNIHYYADRLCITPDYLNRMVKRTLGVTVKEYMNRKIVQEIRNLLDYTTLSVTENAEQLHFDSASYLVRFFMKQTGISPLQYRGEKKSMKMNR